MKEKEREEDPEEVTRCVTHYFTSSFTGHPSLFSSLLSQPGINDEEPAEREVKRSDGKRENASNRRAPKKKRNLSLMVSPIVQYEFFPSLSLVGEQLMADQ